MSCSYKSVSFEDMLSTFEITVNMQLLFKKKQLLAFLPGKLAQILLGWESCSCYETSFNHQCSGPQFNLWL